MDELITLTAIVFVANIITGNIGGFVIHTYSPMSLRQALWGAWLTLSLAVLPAIFATLYLTGNVQQAIASSSVILAYLIGLLMGFKLTCYLRECPCPPRPEHLE